MENLLNRDQKLVANSAKNTRILVQAGPGTGKTHTLVQRLIYLIEVEYLIPAQEILVLSFSVAAVAELKIRLQQAVEEGMGKDDLLFIQVRTFDSFASRLMIELGRRENLSSMNYEERIQKFTTLLKEDPELQQRVSSYKHILVDEIQDLVGSRALMTFELLYAANCGFTLLGDSAQGIYDFQIVDNRDITSTKLIEKIKSDLKQPPEEIRFSKNYRIEDEDSDLKKIAEQGRQLILDNVAEGAAFIYSIYEKLDSLGKLSGFQLPNHLLNSKFAILCRDNGQVLELASNLIHESIPFQIRRRRDDHIIPAWPGRVLFSYEDDQIRRSEFRQICEDRNSDDLLNWEDAWKILCGLVNEPFKSRSLSIERLQAALNEGAVFPNSESLDKNGIVLSTIHRAKGREFDYVTVVVGDEFPVEEAIDTDVPFLNEDGDGETRVLFVGMTRARKGLFRMEAGRRDGLRSDKETDRWIKVPWRTINGRQRQVFTGIQLGIKGDCDRHSFVSERLFHSIHGIQENQQFISNLIYGEPVDLCYCTKKNGKPVYSIIIRNRGQKIGETSTGFGADICTVIRRQNGNQTMIPHLITDVWVSSVLTEVGDTHPDEPVPRELLISGMWLGVRLEGLGRCTDWGEW